MDASDHTGTAVDRALAMAQTVRIFVGREMFKQGGAD